MWCFHTQNYYGEPNYFLHPWNIPIFFLDNNQDVILQVTRNLNFTVVYLRALGTSSQSWVSRVQKSLVPVGSYRAAQRHLRSTPQNLYVTLHGKQTSADALWEMSQDYPVGPKGIPSVLTRGAQREILP